MSEALAIRPAVESDLGLVYDSWIESYRHSHAAGMIAMDDWRAIMSGQIAKVLARPHVEVLMAYAPQAHGPWADLYGWICFERGQPHVHRGVAYQRPLIIYEFIKQPYRRMGIGASLLGATGVRLGDPWMYACKTGVVTELADAGKLGRGRWFPLLIRYPPEAPDEARLPRPRAPEPRADPRPRPPLP